MVVANLRVMGRATQGVKLINLKGNDSIAAVAKVVHDDDDDDDKEEGGTIENAGDTEDGTTLDNNLDNNITEN
jgi:DNA gyrase subunit A